MGKELSIVMNVSLIINNDDQMPDLTDRYKNSNLKITLQRKIQHPVKSAAAINSQFALITISGCLSHCFLLPIDMIGFAPFNCLS